MLTEVTVKNFQALKDVRFPLAAPGVNIIVGPSDVGKSSLIRALRGATQQGEGSSFVREGASTAKVTIQTADGHTVEWHKGKKANRYVLDGEKFGKPGRSVPEPVADALDMKASAFGETCERLLPFSAQGEPAFMVADPSAEIARIIGGVSGAAVLADAVREADRSSRGLARDVASAQRVKDTACEVLSEFDDLAQAAPLQDSFEKQLRGIQEREVERAEAGALLIAYDVEVEEIERCAEELASADSLMNVLQVVPVLCERTARLTDALVWVSRAEEVVGQFRSTKVEKKATAAVLPILAPVSDIAVRVQALSVASEYIRRAGVVSADFALSKTALQASKSLCDDLYGVADVAVRVGVLAEMRVALSECRSADAREERARAERADAEASARGAKAAWDAYVEANPTCPLCGSDMGGTA